MRMPLFPLFVALVLAAAVNHATAQPTGKEKKPAKGKAAAKAKTEPIVLNPFDRPEGAINDQTARYYVWYDSQGWHLRTTAKGARNFNGTIRLKDARIKSCLSVGLKNDKQKKTNTDQWRVNDDRSELQFKFTTSTLSDGFDIVVDGEEGQIEFDLLIDTQKNPRNVFVGRALAHPDKIPFSLPAAPTRPNAKAKQ